MKKTKRLFVLLFAAAMALTLVACSGDGDKNDSPEAKFYGTWTISDCEVNGVKMTADEYKALIGEDISDFSLVLKDGSACIFTYKNDQRFGTWSVVEGGLKIGDAECPISENSLRLSVADDALYLQKTSDSQETPKVAAQETPKESAVEEAPTPASDEVSPEFKEMMDSYEAFFDEYVEFMKKYQSSDDVVGMLADYSDYMARYAETMEKIGALKNEKLSAADAAYLAEVQARITAKTLEVL